MLLHFRDFIIYIIDISHSFHHKLLACLPGLFVVCVVYIVYLFTKCRRLWQNILIKTAAAAACRLHQFVVVDLDLLILLIHLFARPLRSLPSQLVIKDSFKTNS